MTLNARIFLAGLMLALFGAMVKQPTPPQVVAEHARSSKERAGSYATRSGRTHRSRLLGEPGIAMKNGSPCLPVATPIGLHG